MKSIKTEELRTGGGNGDRHQEAGGCVAIKTVSEYICMLRSLIRVPRDGLFAVKISSAPPREVLDIARKSDQIRS